MIYLLEETEGFSQKNLARMLLQYGLYHEYQISGEIKIAYAEHGKPYLAEHPEIHFNYSHCRQGILCGLDSHEIGVDIEHRIPYQQNLAKRIFHPNEWERSLKIAEKSTFLTRIWTLKESYLKYLGTGIRSDLRALDFSDNTENVFQKEDCHFQVIQTSHYGIAICGETMEYQFCKLEVQDL